MAVHIHAVDSECSRLILSQYASAFDMVHNYRCTTTKFFGLHCTPGSSSRNLGSKVKGEIKKKLCDIFDADWSACACILN